LEPEDQADVLEFKVKVPVMVNPEVIPAGAELKIFREPTPSRKREADPITMAKLLKAKHARVLAMGST
jgi:hypothetical protein